MGYAVICLPDNVNHMLFEKEAPPGCIACKWCRPLLNEEVPSKYFSASELGKCDLYNTIIWWPKLHFCSRLSINTDKTHPGFERESIEDDQLYVWVEIMYRVLSSPSQKHVYYESARIEQLKQFVNLTTAQKRWRYLRLHRATWLKFKQGFGETIEEESMYRKRYGRKGKPK